MALRDELRERVTPMLEPGEQIQQVKQAQSGMSPLLLGGLGGALALLLNKYYVMAATGLAIVVISASKLIPSKPKKVVGRVPRTSTLSFPGKLWGKGDLGGTTYYVHRRFFADVEAAGRIM